MRVAKRHHNYQMSFCMCLLLVGREAKHYSVYHHKMTKKETFKKKKMRQIYRTKSFWRPINQFSHTHTHRGKEGARNYLHSRTHVTALQKVCVYQSMARSAHLDDAKNLWSCVNAWLDRQIFIRFFGVSPHFSRQRREEKNCKIAKMASSYADKLTTHVHTAGTLLPFIRYKNMLQAARVCAITIAIIQINDEQI